MLAVADWTQFILGWLMMIAPTVASFMFVGGLVWAVVASMQKPTSDPNTPTNATKMAHPDTNSSRTV